MINPLKNVHPWPFFRSASFDSPRHSVEPSEASESALTRRFANTFRVLDPSSRERCGLEAALPRGAAAVVSLLITIACLGAIQRTIFSGARLYSRFLEIFGSSTQLSRTAKAPIAPIPYLLQMFVSSVIISVAGTFSSAVVYTTTIVWLCFLLRGLCVPVIRARRGPPTSLAVPLYPLPLIIFCVSCLYLIWGVFTYSPGGTAISLTIAALGLAISPPSSSEG